MRRTMRRIALVGPWMRDERGSFSLIGMLIVVVIIMVLTLLILGGQQIFSREGSAGSGGVGGALGGSVGGALAVRKEAQGTVCRNNLSQLRMAIQMATQQSETGGPPASLEDVARSSPGVQLKCPVGGEPYGYDPATGQVHCVHPGHERF
jgi:hypothetical protein